MRIVFVECREGFETHKKTGFRRDSGLGSLQQNPSRRYWRQTENLIRASCNIEELHTP